MKELLLTLSTATRMGSLAVTCGEQLLGEVTIDPVRTQSEVLLASLEHLLSDLSLTLEDMDAFAAVQGPGAFTGLRVGIATIKGFAMATGKPVIGVSSLQTLALQVPEAPVPVYALIDARKNEVYSGRFIWEGGLPRVSGGERVVDPSQLLEEIEGEAIFVGDGSTAYRTLIVRQLGDRCRFAPWSAHIMRASSAAHLALAKLRASEVTVPENFNPIYIRPSDAEINISETSINKG